MLEPPRPPPRGVRGDARDADWAACDGFYFFNPFAENLFIPEDCFDRTVPLTAERYQRDIGWAEQRLARRRSGAVVATYHGFGGAMPTCYELAHEEPCGSDAVRIWVKQPEAPRAAADRPASAGVGS